MMRVDHSRCPTQLHSHNSHDWSNATDVYYRLYQLWQRAFDILTPALVLNCRKSTYDLIHGDRDAFEKIAIVPNMISSHVPDNVKKAFDVVQSEIK